MEFYWDIVDDFTMLLYDKNYDYPLVKSHYETEDGEEYIYVNGIVDDFINYELIVEFEEFIDINELQSIIVKDLSNFIMGEILFWQNALDGLNDM